MPWKSGQSGNPSGRPKDKAFADALRLAVSEDDPVTGKRKLRAIADRLVVEALKGESWAIQQVADRIDGKPAQSIDATVTDEREPSELGTSELLAEIARTLGETKEAANGAGGPAKGKKRSTDVRQLN